MWKKFFKQKENHFAAGINVSIDELIALRSEAGQQAIRMRKQPGELSFGANIKNRGRGIEFDKTREYQPGDDVRRMAWRVTARSLKPHIKVYHEERERPVWLAVDLSPSLYFGTRRMFKSVCSIKQAALLGWAYLQKRERIGAFIATPHNNEIYSPQASERHFLLILKALANHSNSPPPFTADNCLKQLLLRIEKQIRPGNLLFILSDFLQFDENNKKILLHIAARVQVKLIFIYDVFESLPPPAYRYMLTDGEQAILFNMENSKYRAAYTRQFQDKHNELIHFSRQHNIGLQTLRTDQEQGDVKLWMPYNN